MTSVFLLTTVRNSDLIKRAAEEDLFATANIGVSAPRMVRYNADTLNTPYKSGFTDSIDSGLAIISMGSSNYGAILCLPEGGESTRTSPYLCKKTNGSWGEWNRIAILQDLNSLNLKPLYALDSMYSFKIEKSTDLNDLMSPGSYYSPNDEITNTLTNCPIENMGFTMIVDCYTGNDPNFIRQTIRYGTNTAVRLHQGSASWQEWVEK